MIRPRLHALLYCLLTFFGLAGYTAANGQGAILENDTTICAGAGLWLHGSHLFGDALPAGNDTMSGVINIGFPFTFYGNTYTRCVLSTDGFITFDTTKANQRSPLPQTVTGNFPGNPDVRNAIMGLYSNLTTTGGRFSAFAGASITYSTIGFAPNRIFVYDCCFNDLDDCNTFGPGITAKIRFQIALHETSNLIDFFIADKPACLLNTSLAIQGVHNLSGTAATITPNHDYTAQWGATNEGKRYTPNGSGSYTISNIPFMRYSAAPAGNFTWYTVAGTPLSTNDTFFVAPTQTTTYYARQESCTDAITDSVTIFVVNNTAFTNATTTPATSCGIANGTLTIHGLTANGRYNIQLLRNGIGGARVTYTANASGDISISNLSAGAYTFNLTSCAPVVNNGPYVITEPPLVTDFTFVLKPACKGMDTVVFTNTTASPGNIGYTWDFGDGTASTTTSPTHIYASQGPYRVQLTAANGNCIDTAVKVVDTRHPLTARMIVDYDTVCAGVVLNFKDSSTYSIGTAPTYTWDFGDSTTGTGVAPLHSYVHGGLYRVRMIITDGVPCSDTVYKNIFVGGTPSILFSTDSTRLCEGQGIVLTATFIGSNPRSYIWAIGDGTTIRNENPISHAFDVAGSYNITLSAYYGYCPDTFFTKPIVIHPFPNVNLGPDTAFCPGDAPLTLIDYAATSGSVQYAWSTGASGAFIDVNKEGTYALTKTMQGCSTSDSITVYKNCYLDIPNVFSPNNDGTNDYFLPRQLLSRGVVSFRMNIYNRWGQKVFEANAPNGRGWNGQFNDKDQPQGAYVYLIEATFSNGLSKKYQGNVTLIR